MKKAILLIDFPLINSHCEWELEVFRAGGYEIIPLGVDDLLLKDRTNRKRFIILQYKYFKTAFAAVQKSDNNTIIICKLDYLAIYTWIISSFLKRRSKIVCINLMLNENAHKLKKYIYKTILNKQRIFPTVNSLSLINFYKVNAGIKSDKFHLLYDDCRFQMGLDRIFSKGNGSVFCGGYNSRDWELLINIANLNSNIEFVFIGKSGFLNQYIVPNNVQYFEEVSDSFFNQKIEQSSLVLMPVTTEAPAGLLVIFSAALLSKPVIATNTISMREYINHNLSGLLYEKSNESSLNEMINYVLSDVKIQQQLGTELNKSIKAKCSPQAYAEKLLEIVNEVDLK